MMASPAPVVFRTPATRSPVLVTDRKTVLGVSVFASTPPAGRFRSQEMNPVGSTLVELLPGSLVRTDGVPTVGVGVGGTAGVSRGVAVSACDDIGPAAENSARPSSRSTAQNGA